MSIIDTKQITRQFFDDAYNQGNLEGIDNLVTPSFVYHARGEDVQGIENFKKWIVFGLCHLWRSCLNTLSPC